MVSLENVDLGDAGSECALEVERRDRQAGLANLFDVQRWLSHCACLGLEVCLCFSPLEVFRNIDAVCFLWVNRYSRHGSRDIEPLVFGLRERDRTNRTYASNKDFVAAKPGSTVLRLDLRGDALEVRP